MRQYVNEFKEAEQYKNTLLRIELRIKGIYRKLVELENREKKQ